MATPKAAGAASTDRSGTRARDRRSRPRAYARHPGDVLRVLLGALVLLATMTAIHRDRIGVREANLFRLLNDLGLPGWTRWPVWGVMQLGVIGAVPLVAGLALLTRRIRLAAYAALAGGTIYLVAKLVKEFVQRGRPQTLLDNVYIFDVPDRGLGYVSGHSAVAVALATVASPFLGRRARRVAWVLAGLVCVARIYVGSHLPFDVLGGAALGWAAGSLVLLVFGAPTGQPSLQRVRAALQTYGFNPADLAPLPGEDRRSAGYLVASHSHPDLFVKVVTRERRDSDLLYRAWDWLRHRGRPPSRLGDAVAQVEHEASMGLLAAAAGVRTPPVLLVRSFGNGAGLLVQQRVHGHDLTELDGRRLDQARLADLWQQVARLRKARIAHHDLGLGSVMVDEHGRVWLVDFDRAEAAANQALLDHDAATLLAALDGVADQELVRATAEQASARTRSGTCCRRLCPRRPPRSRRPQRPDKTLSDLRCHLHQPVSGQPSRRHPRRHRRHAAPLTARACRCPPSRLLLSGSISCGAVGRKGLTQTSVQGREPVQRERRRLCADGRAATQLLAVPLTLRRSRSTLTVMRDPAAGVEHRFGSRSLQAATRFASDQGPRARRPHRGRR